MRSSARDGVLQQHRTLVLAIDLRQGLGQRGVAWKIQRPSSQGATCPGATGCTALRPWGRAAVAGRPRWPRGRRRDGLPPGLPAPTGRRSRLTTKVVPMDAQMVSFRENRRDGMPVARILGDEIVVVIEDNNVDRFKPYTVRTEKLKDNWVKPVLADSPHREYALAEEDRQFRYIGAPYLLKLPTSETLISYQTNEKRASDWESHTQ